MYLSSCVLIEHVPRMQIEILHFQVGLLQFYQWQLQLENIHAFANISWQKL